MGRKIVSLRIDEDLLARIDAAALAAGWNRTGFFIQAAEALLSDAPALVVPGVVRARALVGRERVLRDRQARLNRKGKG